MTATWVDRITGHLARRPSGRIGRTLYRHAAGHQAGFQFALQQVPRGPADRNGARAAHRRR
ncbi:hypothetical protein [Xanthobacter sp. KR7-225]|uniref:hypothetical protein n=1 Tax=Xanthobacter sp. KR7-225 TaxID=3156613 RepID=UPI0032B580D5